MGSAQVWFTLGFTVVLCTPPVSPHGRLIEPPSRASMWRYGFSSPPDYNDHESYCGGFTRQWVRNGGRCGICGDPWDSPQPRAHEGGGTYGQGIVVRRYKRGSAFTIRVEVTANHRGHFEFRLCEHNSPKTVASQECLDQHVLRRAKTSPDNFHPTKYFIGSESKVYEMRYLLPQELTCSQCVLQWKYLAANNWGRCDNGSSAIGCGPQEEFRACADIAIEDKHRPGVPDHTPAKEPEDEDVTEHDHEHELATDTNRVDDAGSYAEQTGRYYLLSFYIMLAAMFLSIFVYTLLFIYYYGANKTIKPCWQTVVEGTRNGFSFSKKTKSPPVPPPRTRKYLPGSIQHPLPSDSCMI